MTRDGLRLALCVLLCVTACVEADPLYCERDQTCPPNMRCLLPQRECVLKPEICANGVDDNGDMHIDCDDPLCQEDPLCQALPQGAVYGIVNTSASGTPGCGVSTTAVGTNFYTSITGQNACNGCKCVVDCGISLQVFQTQDECRNLINPIETVALTGTCQDITPRVTPMAYQAQGGAMATCKQDPTARPTPIYNATQGRICQHNNLRMDCTTPSCVLTAYARYNPCVLLEGDVACPAGFQTRQRWYRGVNDTRTCSCCGVPASRTCNFSVSVFDAAACSGNRGTVGSCNQMAQVLSTRVSLGNVPTCNATSSISGGSIEPTGPLTLCCR